MIGWTYRENEVITLKHQEHFKLKILLELDHSIDEVTIIYYCGFVGTTQAILIAGEKNISGFYRTKTFIS